MASVSTNKRSYWTLGYLLPRLMLLCMVLDLVFPFVPLDTLTFRAWEAALRRYPNAPGPFKPDMHFHRDDSYGGAASIGNLPALRQYHPADFTTDAYGFHNPPALSQPNPVGILIGDSFAVGSELPEDQTLTAQLTRLSGSYFYNAGGPQPLRLRSLQSVAQRIGLHRGLVIYEFLESHALDRPPSATPDGGHGWGQTTFLRLLGTNWGDRLRTPINEFHGSPLQGLSVKIEKNLQNGVFLPNSFSAFVVQAKLRNGVSMVFLPNEFKLPPSPKEPAAQWAAYFAWYAAELRKDALDFMVVLVPGRPAIYGPFFDPPQETAAFRAVHDAFTEALQSKGVSVVPLLPRYEQEAPLLFRKNVYLYNPDDAHWNSCGTGVAASEILLHLPSEVWSRYGRPAPSNVPASADAPSLSSCQSAAN